MPRDGGPEERYRYRCPMGHADIRERGDGYYCRSCARYSDRDPRFEESELVDTGSRVERGRESGGA